MKSVWVVEVQSAVGKRQWMQFRCYFRCRDAREAVEEKRQMGLTGYRARRYTEGSPALTAGQRGAIEKLRTAFCRDHSGAWTCCKTQIAIAAVLAAFKQPK